MSYGLIAVIIVIGIVIGAIATKSVPNVMYLSAVEEIFMKH